MKKLTIHKSRKAVFEDVIQVAINLDLDIQEKSLTEGTLLLSTNGGLFSYGNVIEIELKSSEPNKTVLNVNSRSTAAIQIIDWGTNDNLEAKIIEQIKSIL